MTGVETAMETQKTSCNPETMDPTPAPSASRPNPIRDRIRHRVEILRSLRRPTVEQIEARLFWEEYLKTVEGNETTP